MGQNAICRQEDVTGDSVRSRIILASEQVSSFTEYMQRDLHLERVQIDEFCSLAPYLPITDSDPFFGHQLFQGKWPAGM